MHGTERLSVLFIQKWNIWNLERNKNLLWVWCENRKECDIEYEQKVSYLESSSLDVKKVWVKYSFIQYIYGFMKYCAQCNGPMNFWNLSKFLWNKMWWK